MTILEFRILYVLAALALAMFLVLFVNVICSIIKDGISLLKRGDKD